MGIKFNLNLTISGFKSRLLFMKYKKLLEQVVKKIQHEKHIDRTSALIRIADRYDISYTPLHTLIKHSRLPQTKSKVKVLEKIFLEELDYKPSANLDKMLRGSK